MRLAGFGNAAGVAATHNVFGGLGNASSRIAQSFARSPSEDALAVPSSLASNPLPAASSSSSSSSSSSPGGDQSGQDEDGSSSQGGRLGGRQMSEEEAERLMGMIERMEELGVIKVLRKDDM